MLKRIGNRAYRFLNDVLTLPGAVNLGSIDLGQAFAVHDLQGVIEAGLAVRFTEYTDSVIGGAGGVSVDHTPAYKEAGTVYKLGGDEVAIDGDHFTITTAYRTTVFPVEPDWDQYLLACGGIASTIGNLDFIAFWLENVGFSGNNSHIPVTSVLDTGLYAGIIGPTSGEPYFLHPPPLRVDGDNGTRFRYRVQATAATDITVATEWLCAPPGVLTGNL